MLISGFIGYVPILIAFGFAITATFSAADKRGLLDRGKRSQAARELCRPEYQTPVGFDNDGLERVRRTALHKPVAEYA
jgi:hypothetical protein